MKRKTKSDRGGLAHILVALSLISAVSLTGFYGESLNGLISERSLPGRISMASSKGAACAANTVDTIVGTLGCGSTAKGAHLSSITFVSASKE